MADKYYFCASAGKDVVITKNVIKTGGTVSMGILGKIATSACSNQFDCPHSEKCDQTGGSREFHPKLCEVRNKESCPLLRAAFFTFPVSFSCGAQYAAIPTGTARRRRRGAASQAQIAFSS